MRESPARLLPCQRVQQAAAVAATLPLQRQQQQLQVTEPAYEDMADPLTGSATHLGPVQSDVSPMWNRCLLLST
jgi:hypothetical protein